MREIPPLVFGVFAALLLIPAFFWAGGKLLHMRVDEWPLAVAGATLFIFYFLRKK